MHLNTIYNYRSALQHNLELKKWAYTQSRTNEMDLKRNLELKKWALKHNLELKKWALKHNLELAKWT